MERMSERKGELGLLMFVPDLFRSIVLYNIAARNRIDDDLEAERTLHKLDLEATLSTLPELVLSRKDEPEEEESPEPTEGEVPEEGPSEAAEREAIDALSEAISQVAQGEEAGTDAIARIAASLDLSLLSVWERQALTSDEPGQAVLRTVGSVGLLLKKAEELEPALGVLGLSIARLEGHWVPELDTRLREQITERLMARTQGSMGSGQGDARRLSQTRVKFLYKVLEAKRREEALERRQREGAPEGLPPEGMEIPQGEIPELKKFHPRRKSERPSLSRSRAMAIGAAVTVLVISAAIQVYSAKDEHSVSVLSPALLADVSPYLQSAYRDGVGFGPKLFGTLTDAWKTLDEKKRYEEAMEMGARLRWHGVREIMLFDRKRRLQVRLVRGELLHLQAPDEI